MQILPDGSVQIKSNTGLTKIVQPNELPNYGISYTDYQNQKNAYDQTVNNKPVNPTLDTGTVAPTPAPLPTMQSTEGEVTQPAVPNNPEQQVRQSVPPKPWTSGNKIIDKVVDWLPTIGAVGGGILGTPADIVSGPAGNIIGAAGGGALGEAGKEFITGEKPNALKIGEQGALGGASQGVGEIAGPLIGKAVGKVAELPIIGPIIKGVSNWGESNFAKLFGAGDVSSVDGGVNGLVKTANEVGLTKLNSLNAIREASGTALDTAGKNLGDALAQADAKGAGTTYKELTDIIDKYAPKITSDSVAAKQLVDSAKATISNTVVDVSKTLPNDETIVPSSAVNKLKQLFAEAGNFGTKEPNIDEQFARRVSGALKDSVEKSTQGIADVKDLNQQWWNLKQINTNLQKVANRSVGARPFSPTPAGMLRTPSAQLAIGQAYQSVPPIIGKTALTRGVQSLPNIVNPTKQPEKPTDITSLPDFPKEKYPIKNYQSDISRDPNNEKYYTNLYQKYQEDYTNEVEKWKIEHPKLTQTQPGLTTILNRAAGSAFSSVLPNVGQ